MMLSIVSQDGKGARGRNDVSASQRPSLTDLSRSAGQSDRNGLTGAGRALQKHGSRAGSVFPQVSGHRDLNEISQRIVDDILTDPNGTIRYLTKKNYCEVIEIFATDGRGLRFDAKTWEFIGFLEP